MTSGLPGTVTAKALLGYPVRAPLQPAGPDEVSRLRAARDALAHMGIFGPSGV